MISPRIYLLKAAINAAISSSQLHPKDVGSTPVQLAILRAKLQRRSTHLCAHKKDKHNIRQVVMLAKRIKKLQAYQDRQKLKNKK